jgi:hypothetical protein
MQFIASRDAVRIFREIDQPDAPRLGCNGLRREQNGARIRVRVGCMGDIDNFRQFGQRNASALIAFQLHHRKIHVAQVV